ncbi:MAG TPA: hypothetical protein VII02_14550 [Gemmatimonadaceae bacterium]
MDYLIAGLIMIGTLGLSYIFVFRIAFAGGGQYPPSARTPAIIAAIGTLGSGVIEGMQVAGMLDPTTYLVALAVALATALGAMGVLASRL